MKDFVSERGLPDKWQPDDLAAEQREGRQAESGRLAVFDDGIVGIGIRTDGALVSGQIGRSGFEIVVRQVLLAGQKQRVNAQAVANGPALLMVRSGGQVQ